MLTNRKTGGFAMLLLGGLLVGGCTPPGPHALLDGERLLQEGKTTEAIERLRTATDLLPQNAQAWNHLGLALHAAHQPREAAEAYRKAQEKDKNLAVVHFNYGCLLLEENQPAAAVKELTTYTILQPGDFEGHLQLGHAGARARQWIDAERGYTNAARFNPKNPAVLNGIGMVQLQRRRTREAAGYFQAALQQQKDFAPAVLNLAIITHQYSTNRPAALQLYRDYTALTRQSSAPVNAVIQKLESEIAPPRPPAPVAIATNTPPTLVSAPVKTNAVDTTRTNTVSRKGPTTKPEPEPPKIVPITPLPATTVVSTPPTLPPPAPKPVVVAEVPPPAPTPKPTPPPTPKPETKQAPKPEVVVVKPTPAPDPATEKVEAGTPTTAAKTEEEKQGFFQRMNPANLFKNKTKPATPLPTGRSTVTPTTKSAAPMEVAKAEPVAPPTPTNQPPPAPAIPPRPPIQRYHYQSPARPGAGKRNEAQVAFGQGLELQRTGKPSAAVEAYREAVRLDPSFYEAQYNLGLAAYDSGDLPQSLSAYEFALVLKPDSANARYNFALGLQRGAFYKDAVAELEKILATQPNETRAHLTLANLYAQQLYDYPQAREHYRKVLALEPQHTQAQAIRYWLSTHP